MVTIREVLNRIKWAQGLNVHQVVIIHRGSPGDVKVIEGRSIKELFRNFFIYEEDGVETYIPYHRVLEIRNTSGKVLFKRERRSGGM